MSINGPLGATPKTGSFELRAPSAPRTATTGSRLGLTGLGGVVLTGLVLCVSAAHTNLLLPETVRPIQTFMAGPFGGAGFYLPVGALMLTLAAMFACYVLAVRAADRLSARSVLMAIAALNALVLLAPPLLSTDVFSYQAYAREWITFGANPYLNGPHVMLFDKLYPYIGAKWIETPSAYGPVFTILSGLLAHASISQSLFAFKTLAVFASLGTVALLWHSARLRGLNPVRAVALFGLNPLVVVYGVGGGHNDLLMVLAATAGLYALLAHRERTSGVMFVLGAAVKLTGAVVLPFALASGAGLGADKRRRSILIAAVASSVAIAAASFALFGGGIFNLFGTLRQVQSEGDWHSISGFIGSVFGLGGLAAAVGIALGVVFLGIFGWLLRRVWRGQLDWIDGAAWAVLTMLLTASAVLPWYIAWLLPLVALCTERRLWTYALVLTGVTLFTTMLGYVPHGAEFMGIRLVP